MNMREMNDTDKKYILDNAVILLISDNEEDYEGLITFGFKKVNWFKSIVRANKYFSEHPGELNGYNVVLMGNQTLVTHTLYGLSGLNTSKVIASSLKKYVSNDEPEVIMHLGGKKVYSKSYDEAFDKLVQNIFECGYLEGDVHEYIPIEDYVNPERLPVPNKKSDLKILYLSCSSFKDSKNFCDNLGLNIEFREANNYALENYISKHLGDYDIIIGDSFCFSRILMMGRESYEQCRDTGRNLTLFVTYDSAGIPLNYGHFDIDWKGIGEKVKLKYTFGGLCGSELESSSKTYRLLSDADTGFLTDKILMESIVGAAVNIYNEALPLVSDSQLVDLDLKGVSDFDEDYSEREELYKNTTKTVLNLIRNFDNFKDTVLHYLNLKKKYLVEEELDGLRIVDNDSEICVENILNGRVLCSITFSRNYKYSGVRIFSIQTLTKKGKLCVPSNVGFFIRKYEKVDGMPDFPDDMQMNAINATINKVNSILKPVCEEGRRRLEQESFGQSRKRNNNKGHRRF